MKIIEEGSSFKIGETSFDSIDEFLQISPFIKMNEYAEGSLHQILKVYVRCKDEKEVQLKYSSALSFEDSSKKDSIKDEASILLQMQHYENIKFLRVLWKEMKNLTGVESSVVEDYIIPVIPVDWNKTRRQFEDCLRKNSLFMKRTFEKTHFQLSFKEEE